MRLFNYKVEICMADDFTWFKKYFIRNTDKDYIEWYGIWILDIYFLWFNVDIARMK